MFNNSTLNSTRPGIPVPYYGKIPWTAAFSLQFVMAMMGNFLIVWIVFRDNRLRSSTNYLITNMAVSDLFAALFAFPLMIKFIHFDNQWLIGGVIGNALCKLTPFAVDMSFVVSTYSCVGIAIDRYFAVAYPFKRPFQDKMKKVIAVIWIVAAVICSPSLYFLNARQSGNAFYCSVHRKDKSSFFSYHYILEGLTTILPVLFMTITYTLTICKLYHRQVPGLLTSGQRRRKQQNKKVLKHSVTIVVLLYLCRGFYFTFVMLNAQRKLNHLSDSSYKNLTYAAFFIVYFSLVYNFFIYLIFNDIYRENVKALIPKCCCRYDANMRQERPGEMIEMNELN
ncbi:substance-K receptor-like [Exaiptasia diaphana]|uniref:G-protein coupled receptors family 1 profile domain-containing protein n=1 Tax=Exaiptasia diaphana TaxID=2652724 RepID=A0A913XE06_EXADI|nr:substance-K receptor-like [Exaiptasia diaphana]